MQTFNLDGVPVFRAELSSTDDHDPVTGVYFRVGAHDEDFSTAGLTALATRMILASLPIDVRDQVDVWGSGLFTQFSLRTVGNDSGHGLRALSQAITNIRWDRFEQQKILLQGNDGVEGLVGEAHLFHARYGAVGPGTAWIKKVAFSSATPESVQRWIDKYFTKDNAAIAVVGDVPVGASFPLKSGEAHDFLLLESAATHFPARIVLEPGENAIGVQLTAPLTASSHVAFAILSDALHRRLVTLESLTTDLAVESQVLDANVASFTAIFPVHPINAPQAVAALMQTLDDAANGFIGSDLFERRQGELADASAYPDAHWAVDQAAQRRLFPAIQALETRAHEVSRLTPLAVGEVIKRSMGDTLLLATPPEGAPAAEHLALHQADPGQEVEGTITRLRGPMRVASWRTRLVFSNEGLTLHDKSGATTARFAECLAVLDSGTSLTVVNRSGDTITIFEHAWKKGADVLAAIREGVPKDRFIAVIPDDEERHTAEALRESLRAFSGWRLVFPIMFTLFFAFNGAFILFGTSSERFAAIGRIFAFVLVVLISGYWHRHKARRASTPTAERDLLERDS